MSLKKYKAAIEKTVAAYKAKLAGYTDAEFNQSKGPEVWSAGQVYSHIFDSSILSMEPIKAILEGKGVTGDATLPGKAILLAGAFPPGLRFKVPARLEGRVQQANKAMAAALIAEFEQLLEELYPQMAQADKNARFKHPRLGEFNVAQWLRFTEIHLNHHFKQLARIAI